MTSPLSSQKTLFRLLIGLLPALVALVVTWPRAARAEPQATLIVDRSDDAAGLACTGAANDCTLRSALQIANSNGVPDTINFAASYTITLGTNLPNLTENQTTISASPSQPVWIDGDGVVQNIFRVTGLTVTLDGLRLYGAGTDYSNIWVTGSARNVTISDNVIGDDAPGFLGSCGDSPDSYGGIYIDSSASAGSGQAIAWIHGNFIKCHSGIPGDGITIVGSDRVVIGADAAGNASFIQENFSMLNARNGVSLFSDADNNTIRNSYLQYNGGSGLYISGSSNNVAFENLMQVNDRAGVEVRNGSTLNRIGCPLGGPNDATTRNVIHQNDENGVYIADVGTNSNLVLCNWIGLNDAGTGAAGNLLNGVLITDNARFNVIGSTATERNVISGNRANGVAIYGAGTDNNLVSGNYIGANVSGTLAVSNTLSGVVISDGASLNTVGGSAFSNLNLIAGNGAYGVLIAGSNTATNSVELNDIGYNSIIGTVLPNRSDGIALLNGTHNNFIGDVNKSNYVAYNLGSGVYLAGGAASNSIRTNNVFSNTRHGIVLDGSGTQFNVITGTLVHHNGLDGIAERNSAGINVWTHVSLYDNAGLGIDKDASSDGTNTATGPFPIITAMNQATGVISGTASNSALIELYRVAPDPSGFGEGKTFVASTISNSSGNWSVTLTPGSLSCYTAFQIVGFIIYSSSEFGPGSCLTYLPVILKNP
jgi:parallel beta-helix repeat protein